MSSTAKRPALLDHRKPKGGGQPEQQHSMKCLQGTHHLPVRFQKDVCVTIGCYCAERIEHGGLVVGQRTDEPVGGGPDGPLDGMQNGRQQSRRAHHHCKHRREMASVHCADRTRTTRSLINPTPSTSMTTFSTINGRLPAPSAFQPPTTTRP